MIKTETYTIDGKDFVRTYSDKGMKIHGGMPEAHYDEACDPAELGRTYTETDIPIEDDGEDTGEADKAEAFDILMGEHE